METYREEPSKANFPMSSLGSKVKSNQHSNKTSESVDLKLKNEPKQIQRTPKDLCSNCDHASSCVLKSIERFTYQCEHYQ